ncbi:lipoprotein-releasing ABC transporter ATP-binding protein LolD [Catenovulum maritimum]|uniref:Lipoprotein-releasing system ATP-binding protein LolD n=1 Tax=Catenovulum maritimum TaxID=1513271 RepID=A0A0J8GQU0_9ALTE|nr:lipoprotein-releasing ABC transporter ATP-binding protein LolD [Catenovulum maritimum]KMT65175.1 ABC transporter [Catenovulum maritimum]
MSKPILSCQNLSKIYQDGNNTVKVLDNLSLEIQAAEHLAIVGSSGSGKSTLLHILGALDSPSEGRVLFNGQDIHKLNDDKQAQFRNESLGFVYQFHHLLGEFTALENVAMPLMIAKTPVNQAKKMASEILDKVGLSHRLKHLPSELSGGERQRVAIARALVNQPKLILADEPTGNLDSENAASVFELILSLKELFSTSFVFVTHDLKLASKMDRQLKLDKGQLVEWQAKVVEHV